MNWMEVAALLFIGEYRLAAVICIAGEWGGCDNNHLLMQNISINDLRRFARENCVAPMVFAYPRTFSITMDSIEDEEVLWLGDISRSGAVICGELLAVILNGAELDIPRMYDHKVVEPL